MRFAPASVSAADACGDITQVADVTYNVGSVGSPEPQAAGALSQRWKLYRNQCAVRIHGFGSFVPSSE